MRDDNKSIVLFDGFCNFCSGSVRFIIRRDPGRHFLFAAAQSPEGQTQIRDRGIGEIAEHSLVLVSGNRVFTGSEAVLRIVRKLRAPWPLLYVLILIPGACRDYFYGLLARKRYRIYGRREECFLPDPEIRDRFLGPGGR